MIVFQIQRKEEFMINMEMRPQNNIKDNTGNIIVKKMSDLR